MKPSVTQLWDTRLLYMYGLLGQYVLLDEKQISRAIIDYANGAQHLEYCMQILNNLQKSNHISVTDFNIFRRTKSEDDPADVAEVYFSRKPQAQVKASIHNLDTHYFKDLVSTYLEIYRADEVFNPLGIEHRPYLTQKLELLYGLSNNNQMQQIDGSQNPNMNYRFLETLFSMVDEKVIEIHSIKPSMYGKPNSMTGFKAEVKLLEGLEPLLTNSTKQDHLTNKTAEARIDGTQVYVGIKGEQLVPVGHPLRAYDAPYNFMHYMQTHTNQNVSKLDINAIERCADQDDMTELVRSSRFNKHLKKYFFNGTTSKQVRFTPEIKLNTVQQIEFSKILDAIRKQNENNRI